MKEDKINSRYTAENIEQYFSGKLLPQQMHAMEKAALDDPFLAEAMEGYERMKKESWEKELNGLREKFATKDNTTKIAAIKQPFKWWKAAAAILIIGSGIRLVYLFNNSSSTNNKTINIASVKKDSANTPAVAINADSLVKKEPVIAPTESNNKSLIAKVKPNLVSDSIFLSSKTNNQEVANIALNDDTQKKVDAVSIDNVTALPSQKSNTLQVEKFAELSKATAQNNMPTEDKKRGLLNRSFIAEIVGADNTPLPFANIFIPNENIGTYADVKGKFRLAATDTVITIEVRAAGYAPLTYSLKSSVAQNTIVLNEAQVAAKDIIKFGSKAKKTGTGDRQKVQIDTVLNVEPVDGWNNYDTYLSNNFSPSEEILQNKIHGEVEVSFDVKRNGKLSNVSIAKSLCGDCDEEALRVIKEGPQWKVKKGKKNKGKVKIQF